MRSDECDKGDYNAEDCEIIGFDADVECDHNPCQNCDKKEYPSIDLEPFNYTNFRYSAEIRTPFGGGTAALGVPATARIVLLASATAPTHTVTLSVSESRHHPETQTLADGVLGVLVGRNPPPPQDTVLTCQVVGIGEGIHLDCCAIDVLCK